ncbi:hypothetical protein [Streptomyces sp. NPDC050504]|uniref:hypothetical protein n=1 Tax=Streptomyces sp. NPDC050504 TaxID=3365618 RepID=UPI0037B524AF
MRKPLESLGFLLMIAGIAGLAQEWVGWFRFLDVLQRLPGFDEHPLTANAALAVVGFVVMAGAERVTGKVRG